MFNILSLVLGLLAILLSLHSIRVRFCSICSIFSLICCSGAFMSQLLEVRRRVLLHDWSTLMDTMDAVIFASVFLLAAVLLLNLLALIRKKFPG